MPREKPMMAVEILDSVSKLSIRSFVQLFDNFGARGSCPFAMGFDVFHKYRETLRPAANLRGNGFPLAVLCGP